MKKLLKALGIAAGIYVISDASCILGVMLGNDYYNGRMNERDEIDKMCMEAIDAVDKVFNKRFSKRYNRKSSKKRSEVLRDYAEQWAKKGYSSEEIKQGLDALKKELD